jgi:hypothetical protein
LLKPYATASFGYIATPHCRTFTNVEALFLSSVDALSPLTPQLPRFKQVLCFLQCQTLFVHWPRYVRRADEGVSIVRLFDREK